MKKLSLLFIVISFHSIASFSGHWVDINNSRSLTLELSENGDHIAGRYCFITNNGNRIDCAEDNDTNINGIIQNNVGKVSYTSTFSGVGEATLSMEKDILIYIITNYTPFINANMSVPKVIYFKRENFDKNEHRYNNGENNDDNNINNNYIKLDEELNELYKIKMQQYSKEGAKAYGQTDSRSIYLKKSQQTWIKMRDTNCNYETYESRTDPVFSSIYTKCLLEETKQRIKYLNEK